MQKMNISTIEKKCEAFFQLCNEFPPEMVKKNFIAIEDENLKKSMIKSFEI